MIVKQVHLEPFGSRNHEHITRLRYQKPGDSVMTELSKQEMIALLDKSPDNQAFVADSIGRVEVHVIRANPPYLQTKRDNRLTDNLLDLPRF